MRDFMFSLRGMLLINVVLVASTVSAQDSEPADTPPSKTQRVLDQSEAEGKYTFLIFYRDESPAARTMAQTVKEGVAKRQDEATLTFVQVTNPEEKAIVARFGVSRAPMPLYAVNRSNLLVLWVPRAVPVSSSTVRKALA